MTHEVQGEELSSPARNQPPRRDLPLQVAIALIVAIAVADAILSRRGVSLGVLYLIPLLIAGLGASRGEIIVLGIVCTLLREALGPLAFKAGLAARSALGLAAFCGCGLFVVELTDRRRRRQAEKKQIQDEAARRREAEHQLRVLTETSPAAILTINAEGRIALANQAAHQMLAFSEGKLAGERIGDFLPPLASAPQADGGGRILRTTLECKGRRRNGDVFPAHVWLSSYMTGAGPMLAAIVLDTSEELRDREALGFDQLMKSSRILVRAVSHEIRNICAAIAVVHANLKRLAGMEENEDFQALGRLVEGLGTLVSSELRTAASPLPNVNLADVLEELRIVIEPSFAEDNATVRWMAPERLPTVCADRNGLLHIFMNLATNSQRALRAVEDRRLVVGVSLEGDKAVVRFSDSGPGVTSPEQLFRPFRHTSDGAGLGLYLSRALARSYAGDLRYEPQPYGACFAVELPIARREAALTESE